MPGLQRRNHPVNLVKMFIELCKTCQESLTDMLPVPSFLSHR
jgi:hypothetical protein